MKIINKLNIFSSLIYVAVIFLLLVISATILHFWIKYDFLTLLGITETASDIGKWGTVGDFFGGLLNPIFAFMAFILLTETYKTQKEELELTRKELSESNKALNRQIKDSTFFELFRSYLDSLNKTYIDTHEGRAAFNFIKKKIVIHGSGNSEDIGIAIAESFRSFIYHTKNCNIELYLFSLFNLLKFLDKFSGEIKEHEFIIYSTLDDSQKMIIFYYGIYQSRILENNTYVDVITKHNLLGGIKQETLELEKKITGIGEPLNKLYAGEAYEPASSQGE
jgi:hypothetical protein